MAETPLTRALHTRTVTKEFPALIFLSIKLYAILLIYKKKYYINLKLSNLTNSLLLCRFNRPTVLSTRVCRGFFQLTCL